MRLLSLLLFFSLNLYAMEAQIVSIHPGGPVEDSLIFLSNGKVLKLRAEEKSILLSEKDWFTFEADEDRYISSAIQLTPASQSKKSFAIQKEFKASVLSSLEVADEVFEQGRFVAQESQCYNRAHVWSLEWFLKNGLQSEKTFIFFTRKYIRKFNFEWWFHVSPSIQVIDEAVVKQRMMDLKYGKGPLKLRDWTDIFMRNDSECPIINTYSDYANFPETGWCYVMTVPMYYYQPVDIELFESSEVQKNAWNTEEIRHAYSEAFSEEWNENI